MYIVYYIIIIVEWVTIETVLAENVCHYRNGKNFIWIDWIRDSEHHDQTKHTHKNTTELQHIEMLDVLHDWLWECMQISKWISHLMHDG